jgi:hypothetical protein
LTPAKTTPESNPGWRPVASTRKRRPSRSSEARCSGARADFSEPALPKAHRLGDVGLGPALRVVGPVLGQIEAGVEQGLAARRHVGEEIADLTVVDFAQAAAPLAGHATGGVAFLGEARAVEDKDGVGIGEFLPDVGA